MSASHINHREEVVVLNGSGIRMMDEETEEEKEAEEAEDSEEEDGERTNSTVQR